MFIFQRIQLTPSVHPTGPLLEESAGSGVVPSLSQGKSGTCSASPPLTQVSWLLWLCISQVNGMTDCALMIKKKIQFQQGKGGRHHCEVGPGIYISSRGDNKLYIWVCRKEFKMVFARPLCSLRTLSGTNNDSKHQIHQRFKIRVPLLDQKQIKW